MSPLRTGCSGSLRVRWSIKGCVGGWGPNYGSSPLNIRGEINGAFPKYEVFHFKGEWSNRRGTAGGCGNDTISRRKLINIMKGNVRLKTSSGNFIKNPQFVFSLTDPDPYDAKTRCPVVVSLAQKVTQRKQEHAIGFRIYKVIY